jgi:hypothetical protein
MPAAGTDQLTDAIQHLKEATDDAINNQHADEFEAFEKYLNEVDAYVRETQQAMWAGQARQTIRRIEGGEPLGPEDNEILRTFLISDAEHYVAMENNYNDWMRELKRLVDDICKRANTVDQHSIGELRGVLKDAVRLVPDIRNFLGEKKRIQKFNEAMGALDPASRKTLAKLLRNQLSNPTR